MATDRLYEHYYSLVVKLKYLVLKAAISGGCYHATEGLIREDAMKDGLTSQQFEDICRDVDRHVDYTKLRIHIAPFD
jgi:hypothetical protein